MDASRRERHSITTLLLDWQATADECHLESLLRASAHLVSRTARTVLVRHGVADPAAVDDAVSLVLDHVRRLPGASSSERSVSRFRPQRSRHRRDPGEAFLVWLSTERARDVARSRRAGARHTKPLSLDEHEDSCASLQAFTVSSATTSGDRALFYQSLEKLPARQRAVLHMLIEGHTQTAIAAKLRVCEGTVSRLRSNAIGALRHLLASREP